MQAVQQLESLIDPAHAAAPGKSGPKTVAGKQRVSMNGVTHGLTGQNVFLEAHEYPAYMQLGLQYIAELRPVGVRETQLAQKIIDNNWRLNTIAAVENNLFTTTLVESLRPNDPNDDKTVGMIAKAAVWRTDCAGPNSFEKLGRYETRLQRSQYKLTEEFERLQTIRVRKDGDSFIQSECKAWIWYDHMLALHTSLAAARVAEAEAARVSALESTLSQSELLCKKTIATAAAPSTSPAADHPANLFPNRKEPPGRMRREALFKHAKTAAN